MLGKAIRKLELDMFWEIREAEAEIEKKYYTKIKALKEQCIHKWDDGSSAIYRDEWTDHGGNWVSKKCQICGKGDIERG